MQRDNDMHKNKALSASRLGQLKHQRPQLPSENRMQIDTYAALCRETFRAAKLPHCYRQFGPVAAGDAAMLAPRLSETLHSGAWVDASRCFRTLSGSGRRGGASPAAHGAAASWNARVAVSHEWKSGRTLRVLYELAEVAFVVSASPPSDHRP
jgi:hypothetical protein